MDLHCQMLANILSSWEGVLTIVFHSYWSMSKIQFTATTIKATMSQTTYTIQPGPIGTKTEMMEVGIRPPYMRITRPNIPEEFMRCIFPLNFCFNTTVKLWKHLAMTAICILTGCVLNGECVLFWYLIATMPISNPYQVIYTTWNTIGGANPLHLLAQI